MDINRIIFSVICLATIIAGGPSCNKNPEIPDSPEDTSDFVDMGVSVQWSADGKYGNSDAGRIPTLAETVELVEGCSFEMDEGKESVTCVSEKTGGTVRFPLSGGTLYRLSGDVTEGCVIPCVRTDYRNLDEGRVSELLDYGTGAELYVNHIYSGSELTEDPVACRNATGLVPLDREHDVIPMTVGYCEVLFFDADGKYISTTPAYFSDPVRKEIFPKNARFVAFVYYRDSLMGGGEFHALTYGLRFGENLFPTGTVSYKGRPVMNITPADSEKDILLKLAEAVYLGNCDVVWEKAEYRFSDIYKYMRDELGWRWTMELPIGGGCRYFFNGATIVADYPEGYDDCMNIFGCRALGGESYELHDGVFVNNGGTYCIHDEAGYGDGGAFSHKYFNCEFRLIAGSDPISKCIGGGSGRDGDITIADCIFHSDGAWDVEWHRMEEEPDARMHITVYGCTFDKGICLDDVTGRNSSALLCRNNFASGGSGDFFHVGPGWDLSRDAEAFLQFGGECVSVVVAEKGKKASERLVR